MKNWLQTRKESYKVVVSVKTANITKEHIQDVASALMHIMYDCAIRRDCYIKTPESKYYNMRTNGYELREHGISDVAYLHASNARLVLDAICEMHNLKWFQSYIGYFTGTTCKQMILAYMGADYYWRDYYNRFKSLAAYGNSLIGKEVETEYIDGICTDWHFTQYPFGEHNTKQPAKYTLLLDLIHRGKKGNTVFKGVSYELGRNARDQIKAYARAWANDTVKWGPHGIYQYPAHYLFELKIGRPLYNSSYYGYKDKELTERARLGIIESYEVRERDVVYTLSSGHKVARQLAPNMYIMHEEK